MPTRKFVRYGLNKTDSMGANGVERLANAIIVQAMQDYRDALTSMLRNPRNESARFMAGDCERFFRSGWYRTLTDLDGEWLIDETRKVAIAKHESCRRKTALDT